MKVEGREPQDADEPEQAEKPAFRCKRLKQPSQAGQEAADRKPFQTGRKPPRQSAAQPRGYQVHCCPSLYVRDRREMRVDLAEVKFKTAGGTDSQGRRAESRQISDEAGKRRARATRHWRFQRIPPFPKSTFSRFVVEIRSFKGHDPATAELALPIYPTVAWPDLLPACDPSLTGG